MSGWTINPSTTTTTHVRVMEEPGDMVPLELVITVGGGRGCTVISTESLAAVGMIKLSAGSELTLTRQANFVVSTSLSSGLMERVEVNMKQTTPIQGYAYQGISLFINVVRGCGWSPSMSTSNSPPSAKKKKSSTDEDEISYVNTQHEKGVVDIPVPDGFRDLSLDHKPLGCLCSEIQKPSEWQQYQLTQDQIDQFWRDGYLTNLPVLSSEQCDKLLKEYSVFLDPDKSHDGHGLFYEFHRNQSGDPDNVLLHALGHWRMSPAFHDLCFLPTIAVPAAQLINPSKKCSSIRLWHDQLFSKPPHHGGVVAWHQDYSYWTRTKPMLHMTVHVALDDQTPETGGLHFIPGSHRWSRKGMPLPITDASFGDMESIKRVLTEEEKKGFKPVPSGLKKGHASFHHPLMVHGSYANKSDRPRRAAVVNYISDGVVSDSNESLLNGVPVVKKGERLCGQFFPVVYDPQWSST